MAKYDKTRFYWLQLKEDFFDDDAISWVEEQPNGKDYVLFYLKLCLKSLKTNGILIREIGNMLIPYSHEKLAEITHTPLDTVVVATELFVKIGLIEILSDGELYIPQLAQMVGSQSRSALKKQQQRLTVKGRAELETNVVDKRVDKCPPEIDIEREEKKDIHSISKEKKENETASRFTPPTLQEVERYCLERKNNIDAQYFFDYYTANGWNVGNAQMEDWKATVRNWEWRNKHARQHFENERADTNDNSLLKNIDDVDF